MAYVVSALIFNSLLIILGGVAIYRAFKSKYPWSFFFAGLLLYSLCACGFLFAVVNGEAIYLGDIINIASGAVIALAMGITIWLRDRKNKYL
ncbi:MAG: hypothetical protein IJS61_02775 [Firmicutes bacterium]|nr:hypothetical protein [Bacillota bacterium]